MWGNFITYVPQQIRIVKIVHVYQMAITDEVAEVRELP